MIHERRNLLCKNGHDVAQGECRRCGYTPNTTPVIPSAPDEPGHCDRNPAGDLTEGSSSPYHEYHCGGCGEEFNHD